MHPLSALVLFQAGSAVAREVYTIHSASVVSYSVRGDRGKTRRTDSRGYVKYNREGAESQGVRTAFHGAEAGGTRDVVPCIPGVPAGESRQEGMLADEKGQAVKTAPAGHEVRLRGLGFVLTRVGGFCGGTPLGAFSNASLARRNIGVRHDSPAGCWRCKYHLQRRADQGLKSGSRKRISQSVLLLRPRVSVYVPFFQHCTVLYKLASIPMQPGVL